MKKTGAVIVAAGMSSRMGDFKPMMKMGSITIVKRIIANFQQADVSPIAVVTGFRASELEKHISKLGVICIRNENYETTEMLDSAKLGFSYIADKCDRTFFTPVDIPLFTVSTLLRLMETDAPVAKPSCGGIDGHPILIASSIIPKILEAESRGGLKHAIEACCSFADIVEVSDEGILRDADTPSDYARLVDYHNSQLLRPIIDVSIMREEMMLDKDSAMLLHVIDYEGTVKDACEKIGISYSKAWKLVADIEKHVGFPLLERRQGGEYGGNSALTAEGRELLLKYEAFAADVRKYAGDIFNEYFKAEI